MNPAFVTASRRYSPGPPCVSNLWPSQLRCCNVGTLLRNSRRETPTYEDPGKEPK